MSGFRSVWTSVAVVLGAAALIGGVGAVAGRRQDAAALPNPSTSGGMSLAEALATRRSVRAFGARELTRSQIGQLCWAAQGITEPGKGLRTAPSALALYSVQVYVVDATGLHVYLPKAHALRTLSTEHVLSELRGDAPNGPPIGGAPAVIVLAIDPARLEARAGAHAERYALLEAGHVAQNVLLQATALGLGSVPVGGLDEAKVRATLKLPEGVRPVYLLPVGYAATR
jgi:SagB-type dehydrogenase family enzyme